MYPAEMLVEVTMDGSNIVGPVSVDQLRRGVAAGKVHPSGYARPQGASAWVPVQAFVMQPPQAPPVAHQQQWQAPAQHHHWQAPAQPQQQWQAPPAAQQQWQAPPQQQAAQPHLMYQQGHHGAQPVVSPSAAAAASSQIELALAETQAKLDALRKELESVEEALEIQSFGFYKPRYSFASAEEYKARLGVIREKQKDMITLKRAAHCDKEWTVSGSAAQGKKMVERQTKLMLRAFNGESDAAIAKVRYDNVVTLEQRIRKSRLDVNKLGESQGVVITEEYLEAKLAELYLVHEHREKVQEEREEQRRVREELREEQKALDEAAKAESEAEKEERRYQAALTKARAELAAATGAQHDKLEGLVTKLETELKDAIDRKAKAIARAQLTRSGHVYVLSNIGSFGEGVFKIGMTRRFEPLERVDELGDASVPFPFDVHAIIYCEDAPTLENALHKAFAQRRLNMVNHRKEYFRVTLDEIRDEVQKQHGRLVTFMLDAEAEQWRKTKALLDVPS